METVRSGSFRVLKATQTLQDLDDEVSGMAGADDQVEFVLIDGGEGRFGLWKVDRIPGDLERLKSRFDVGLDAVKLVEVLPHLEVEAQDFSLSTADEIDDIVSTHEIVIETRTLRGKRVVPRTIHLASPDLGGGDALLGGLPFPLPGEEQHTVAGKYTLKYCPRTSCGKSYRLPFIVGGKRVCPNCRREV